MRSPDIAAPASIPVTAGKKMAKTVQKGAESNSPQKEIFPIWILFPIKNDTNDAEIRTIIINWNFIANFALVRVISIKNKSTPIIIFISV